LNRPMRSLRNLFWLYGAVMVGAALSAAETPRQGADLLKTDLLGVFAHPDDETGVAPLMSWYALGQGKVVTHVYCTRGEGGGNMVGTQSGRSLGILREIELRDCLSRLGIRACHFLDREDFAYTEGLGITLEKWGHEETLGRLVRLVRALRPEVIVTMNPAPNPGQHGNHQAAGWLAVEAFDAAADPNRFPEQLRLEGLTIWRPRKLYFGGAGPFQATVVTTNALPDGRNPAQVAGEALANHRSQAFGNLAGSPWLRRPQQLQLVKSVVPFVPQENDLFTGLPIPGVTPARVVPTLPPEPPVAVPLRFLPRPAVSRYEEWVREQGIQPAAVSFTADVPVVAGEATPVPLELVDLPGSPAGTVQWDLPAGWRISPERVEFGGPDRRSTYFRILKVEAPVGAGDGVLVATARTAGTESVARVRLHPVPHLTVPKVGDDLPLDAAVEDPAWAALASVSISPNQVWEGKVTDAADSSGSFRLAHDGRRLFFEVRVRDERVVSNIEPNDIRGHWRSDSIELCLDPAAGAEHTLGAFKVGIFPFDRTGRVRAARDADAQPGEVSESAPGLKLVSHRLPDGYLIRGVVPLATAGIDLSTGRRIGLNVLIYDGDKADAAPGENHNESRLAWAPRAGVQGRPEDWGRADLE
jgi:LmbE family N-acetylglucosaminyl deacetylase